MISHFSRAQSANLRYREKQGALSRRTFLSGSVAATVASIALPGNLQTHAGENKDQERASEASGIAFRLSPAHLAAGAGKRDESLGGIPRRF